MKSMKTQLFYRKCLWISNFFQIFNFIGSSVIYLSLSEIPIYVDSPEAIRVKYNSANYLHTSLGADLFYESTTDHSNLPWTLDSKGRISSLFKKMSHSASYPLSSDFLSSLFVLFLFSLLSSSLVSSLFCLLLLSLVSSAFFSLLSSSLFSSLFFFGLFSLLSCSLVPCYIIFFACS